MTKGADLRTTREQAGISLSRMAQQTHFTKSYLSLVETGKRRAGPDLVAAYGQVEVDRLIENLPAADELPASSYWYTPAVLLGHKGFVLDALGDRSAAQQTASNSLALMPESWSGSEWAEKHRQLADAR